MIEHEKNLKDRSYYEDRYDRYTVEEGLSYEKMLIKAELPKDMDPKEKQRAKAILFHIPMYTFDALVKLLWLA